MGSGGGAWIGQLVGRATLAASLAAARELRLPVITHARACAIDRTLSARAAEMGASREAGQLHLLLCRSWATRGTLTGKPAARYVLAHFRAAIPLVTEDELFSLAGVCIDLGIKLAMRGVFPEAEALFREIEQLSRARLETHPFLYRYLLGTALANLGTVLPNQRRLAEATTTLREALALRRDLATLPHFTHEETQDGIAQTLGSLGIALVPQRQLKEAEDCFRQALAIRRELAEAEEVAPGAGEISPLRQITGAVNPAGLLDRRRRRDLVASLLGNLGNVLSIQGRLTRAEEAYRECIDIRRDLARSPLGFMIRPSLAGNLANLGNLLTEMGHFRDAEDAYRESLEIFSGMARGGDPSLLANVALAQQHLGRALWAQHRLDEAEATLRQGADCGRRVIQAVPAYRDELGSLLSFLGRLLGERGQRQEAEAVLREAITLDPLNLQGGRGRALAGLAALQGTAELAYPYLLDALTAQDRQRATLRQREDRRVFQREQQELYAAMIDCCFQLERHAEAWQWSERARGRSLLETLGGPRPRLQNDSERERYSDWLEAEDALLQAEDQLRRLRLESITGRAAADRGAIDRMRANLAQARAQEEQLYSKLLEEVETAGPLLQFAVPEPDELVAQLRALASGGGAGANARPVLVEFALLELHDADADPATRQSDRFLVFIIPLGVGAAGESGLPLHVREVRWPAGELARVIARFVAAREATGASWEAQHALWEPIPADLGRVFLQPWQSLLDDLAPSTIILVAHSILHALPLHAAEDTFGRSLIERCPVTWLPNATLSGTLVRRMAIQDRPTGRLVLGPPTDAGLAFATLEAAEVVSRWKLTTTGSDAQPYSGERMNIAALHQHAEQLRYLHLATHARFDEAEYLRSHIVFDAEYLTLARLFSDPNLNFSGMRLCYVSSCEGARIHPDAGDDLPGLVWALMYAGAEAVTASLWEANDEAARYLADVFYGSWRDGVTFAEAYQQAVLAVREEHESPMFWATFIMIGNAFVVGA